MLNLPHQTSFGVENNLHVILWPMNSNFIFPKNHKIHYFNLFSNFFFLFLQLFRPSSCQNGQFVRICGQYPNRYLSYGPCPEDTGQNQQQICSRFGWRPLGISCRVDSDCIGRQFAGLNTARAQCDRSQCCAPPLNPNNPQGDNAGGGAYIWWDTCENGGYFTGQNCRTTRDCGQGQNGGDGRWAQYEQICLQGECCTTIRPSPDSSPNNNNNNGNLAVDRCVQFGGRRIRNNGCIRHSDCNILVGRLPELPRIEQIEQIICQQSQCCLMPRTLPIGFTNWAQACPQSGGRFLGMFCEMDQRDCQTTADNLNRTPRRAICELRRYCCATDFVPNDQQGNGNLGCQIGDRPVGSQCRQDSNCLQGEYCGNQNFCCLRRGNDDIMPRPDTYPPFPNNPLSVPAFCYNGQQSLVPCRSQIDCKQMTQACVNGLCCTRTGDEWKNACGGAMAVSSCFQDRSCHDSLVCTSADYCCECPFGQAAGKCTHGCPPNYSCISAGGEYCCPRCPGGDQPFGSCYNGQCGTGYICSAGNICCRN